MNTIIHFPRKHKPIIASFLNKNNTFYQHVVFTVPCAYEAELGESWVHTNKTPITGNSIFHRLLSRRLTNDALQTSPLVLDYNEVPAGHEARTRPLSQCQWGSVQLSPIVGSTYGPSQSTSHSGGGGFRVSVRERYIGGVLAIVAFLIKIVCPSSCRYRIHSIYYYASIWGISTAFERKRKEDSAMHQWSL